MTRAETGFASCFTAQRDGVTLRVWERILAADARRFPDVSSCYWPALLGRSKEPSLAVTIVDRVG